MDEREGSLIINPQYMNHCKMIMCNHKNIIISFKGSERLKVLYSFKGRPGGVFTFLLSQGDMVIVDFTFSAEEGGGGIPHGPSCMPLASFTILAC